MVKRVMMILFTFLTLPLWSLRTRPGVRILELGELETLDKKQLLEAALIFSGDDQRTESLWLQYENLLMSAREHLVDFAVSRQPEELLFFLHDQIFFSYEEEQSSLDLLLNGGNYNCLSSALIYYFLLDDLGFTVKGVRTTDHAFCAVLAEGDWIDVETTSLYGFNPGEKKEFEQSFQGRTGFAYVPPGNYRNRQDLDLKELVSLTAQNTIALLQRRGEYEAAVGVAYDRFAFLLTEESRQGIVESLSNFISQLNESGLHSMGLEVLWNLRQEFGLDSQYLLLVRALINNAMVKIIQENAFLEGKELLVQWSEERLLDRGFLMNQGDALYGAQIKRILDEGNLASALELVQEAERLDYFDPARSLEFLVFIHTNRMNEIASQEGFPQALAYIASLEDSIRSNRVIRQARETYTYNITVEIHNQVVDFLGRGDVSGALGLVQDSLKLYPGSSLLQEDLEYLESLPR